jgi:hypothetical protein
MCEEFVVGLLPPWSELIAKVRAEKRPIIDVQNLDRHPDAVFDA